MIQNRNVLIIGSGVMGRALATIMANNGWSGKINLVAKTDQQVASATAAVPEVVKVGKAYDFPFWDQKAIVLAIKPQSFSDLVLPWCGKLDEDTLVISIAAGVTTKSLMEGLQHDKVVRAMTNTPARLGQGTTVWLPTVGAYSPSARQLAKEIFSCWGTEMEVSREELLDVVTATLGSLPAYLARFLMGIIAGAVKNGLPHRSAKNLVVAAAVGSLALINQQPEKSLADFCDEVTSPGGTTACALHVLERRALVATLTEAVEAALAQARKLSR